MSVVALQKAMPAPTAKPAIVLEWGAVYVRCGIAGEPCPRVRLPSPLGALAQGGERLNETAWRGALDEFVAKLFAEELLTMPQKRIVLNVEDAALPRALRRALADALYDAGAERLAFAPSIACAAVAAVGTSNVAAAAAKDCRREHFGALPALGRIASTPHAASTRSLDMCSMVTMPRDAQKASNHSRRSRAQPCVLPGREFGMILQICRVAQDKSEIAS